VYHGYGGKVSLVSLYQPIGTTKESRIMAFLSGYFDESGKHAQQKVVSFCGFLSSAPAWEKFRSEWEWLLRKYRKPYLHLSKEKLASTLTEMQMYRDFIRVITDNIEHGFALAVDVAGFKGMPRPVQIRMGDDPHYLAFSHVLVNIVKYASVMHDPTVDIICDDDPEKACVTYQMYRRIQQKDSTNRKVFKSIAFADDEYYPQLQAADLFSWASRAEALSRFFGEKYSLRAIYEDFSALYNGKKTLYTSAFWTKEDLEQYAKRVFPRLPKVQK
jgi:hypothetical protein